MGIVHSDRLNLLKQNFNTKKDANTSSEARKVENVQLRPRDCSKRAKSKEQTESKKKGGKRKVHNLIKQTTALVIPSSTPTFGTRPIRQCSHFT
jgi:hypothetical protein